MPVVPSDDGLDALRSFCARTGIEVPKMPAHGAPDGWVDKVQFTLNMLAKHLEALEEIVLRMRHP